MTDAPVVLDASALLAPLQGEHGGVHVGRLLPRAVISAVNLYAVAAKLAEHGAPTGDLRAVLDGPNLDVRSFATHLGATAISADRTRSSLPDPKPRIELIS